MVTTPSDERSGFAARLSEVCDDMKMPSRGRQTRLAEAFKVTPKAARKWLTGQGLPELEMVVRIAKWGHVHMDWLLTGRGPKRGNLVDTKDLALGEMVKGLPAATREEIADYLSYKIERGVPSLAQEERARYLQVIAVYRLPPT